MEMIAAEGLVKHYGTSCAVDHISFKVDEGEVFGFLGPNGAGKTTTIKMLNTLMKIEGGRAWVAGLDVAKQPKEVRKTIGLVPQSSTLDRDLAGRQNLVIQAKLYDVPDRVAAKKIEELLELVDLKAVADRVVGTYSWGMQRRLEIAMGLVHTPRVLFLDEPTLGLDAQSRLLIWKHIERLNRDFRMTIFLTTHYLEEADDLCDRIAIINAGRIQAEGTPDELKRASGGDLVTLRLAERMEESELRKILSPVGGLSKLSQEGTSVVLETPRGDEAVPRVLAALYAKGIEVLSVDVQRRTLNEVFAELVGRSLSANEQDQDSRLLTRMRFFRESNV